MNDNDRIAKLIQDERLAAEREQARPPKVNDKPVQMARNVWIYGLTGIDALTAYLIYYLTGYIPYGVIWFLAGAGGLLYSEYLKERVGNNNEQMRIGERGVNISAGLVLAMALLSGGLWVTNIRLEWMNALMELTAVGLFFFHLWQSYQYHSTDDEIVARNEEARREARNKKQIGEAHRAARVVESLKVRDGVEDLYRNDHGAAFDAAYGKDVKQQEIKRASFTNRPPSEK